MNDRSPESIIIEALLAKRDALAAANPRMPPTLEEKLFLGSAFREVDIAAVREAIKAIEALKSGT